MLFTNPTLPKNELYQLKNQINKAPIIIKQDNIRVLFQAFLHVILLMSAIFFRVIIMAGFWFTNGRGYIEE